MHCTYSGSQATGGCSRQPQFRTKSERTGIESGPLCFDHAVAEAQAAREFAGVTLTVISLIQPAAVAP